MKKILIYFILLLSISCTKRDSDNYSSYTSIITSSKLLKRLNHNSSFTINKEIENEIVNTFKSNKNYFGFFIYNTLNKNLASKNLKTWKFQALNSGNVKSMNNIEFFEGKLLSSDYKAFKNDFNIETNFISNHNCDFICLKQTLISEAYVIYYFFKLENQKINKNGRIKSFGLIE